MCACAAAQGSGVLEHKALYPGEKGARKKRGHVPNRGQTSQHIML